MRSVAKVLLVIEVVVCFAPMSVVLIVGLILFPSQLSFVLAGPSQLLQFLGTTAQLAAGFAALVAAGALTKYVVTLQSPSLNRWFVLMCAAFAVVTAFGIVLTASTPYWTLIVLLGLPLIVGTQLMCLGRSYLFPEVFPAPDRAPRPPNKRMQRARYG